MRLTLTYQGPLPPMQSQRSKVKADLRREFHSQVKARVEPALGDRGRALATTRHEGFDFISPAHAQLRVAVELDILLLTVPGGSMGDVDNRLKTLTDGLTRPVNSQQMQHFAEPPEGGPTYCLMDDDSLVQRTGLDSRRWYRAGASPNDAFVVVTATLVMQETAGLDGNPTDNLVLLLG